MNNFFRKIFKRRKEYRIGSRPIDSVNGSSSKKKNSRTVNAWTYPTTSTNEEMQNLQRIVGDFEQVYSSPPRSNEPSRGGNFVKRMVAALEQKYNGRRDARRTTPKSKGNCVNAIEEFQIRRSRMNRTFVIKPRCRSVDRITLSSEQSPFFLDEDHNDITDFTFEIEEELPNGKKDTSPKKYDQVIEKDEKNLAESCEKSNSMIKREKAPKIVGAFLKKPIEVEETEIHWIPITNQKLPRKRSFKKLLSLLTGKKSASRDNKLCCPENKMNENILEHRDSGYDNKTSSASSSLPSQTSHNDKPVQQNTKTANQQKNDRVSSFQSAPEANNNAGKPKEDDYPTLQELAKKLMLQEVPRSEVRLSLGPFFPAPVKVDKFVCQETTLEESQEEIYSYESEKVNQCLLMPPLPKHPFVTPLPKHPFISEHSVCGKYHNSIMSIEEVNQIDLIHSQKFPLSELFYDAPRNSLSTSSPDIILKNEQIRSDLKYNNEDTYDVPPTQVLVRRKSCIFEDAVSLKRRSIYLESTSDVGSNFYACPDEEQFATVKPRNNKVLPSQELLRSMADNDNNQLQSPYLVNRLSHFNLVF